jgi:hypothetical protein
MFSSHPTVALETKNVLTNLRPSAHNRQKTIPRKRTTGTWQSAGLSVGSCWATNDYWGGGLAKLLELHVEVGVYDMQTTGTGAC